MEDRKDGHKPEGWYTSPEEEGMAIQQASAVVEFFMEPGSNVEAALLRSRLSRDDLDDIIGTMITAGRFELVDGLTEMLLRLAASAGEDGLARMEGLIAGTPHGTPSSLPESYERRSIRSRLRGITSWFRRPQRQPQEVP